MNPLPSNENLTLSLSVAIHYLYLRLEYMGTTSEAMGILHYNRGNKTTVSIRIANMKAN